MSADQIVFISCGQCAPEEKSLGRAIEQMVRDLTTYRPYFAEAQSSLEGLSRNILGTLYRSVGLIAVMHHRGLAQLSYLHEHVARSSFFAGTCRRIIVLPNNEARGVFWEGLPVSEGADP